MRCASSECSCQQSCEALDLTFATHIQNVLPGLCIDRQSAFSSEQRAALFKAHICFPQKQSRDQIIATFQFIWLLPREAQLSSCFWANSAFSLPLQTRQKFRVFYLSWSFLLLYPHIIYTDSHLALSFHTHWVIFQILKILRHRMNRGGCFRICGSRCNSAAQLHPASVEQIHCPPSGGETHFWYPDLAVPMGHRAGSVMCALRRIFALISI